MFLDIGIGILLSIVVSALFETELTLSLVLFTVACALLPDIDFFVELARHKKVGGTVVREHRNLTHFPLIYIPLALLVATFYGVVWGTLFSLSLFFHFLHDSVGIGWGIKWLWPFSKKSYKFFSEKNGKPSSNLVISWDEQELEQVAREHGDPDWIKHLYLRPSRSSLIELGICIVVLIVLYLYLH